jgi:putative membrane protein
MTTNTTDTRLVGIALALLGALVLLPVLFVGFGMMGAGPMGMGHDGMWGSGGSVPGWWPFVAVLMQLLFLGAVVVFGYLFYQAVVGTRSRSGDRALEELRLAYARGEFDEEEYDRRRDRLKREE